MRNKPKWFLLLSLLQLSIFFYITPLSADTPAGKKPAAPPVKQVYLITVDAPITPVISEYIIKSIDTASQNSAEPLSSGSTLLAGLWIPCARS